MNSDYRYVEPSWAGWAGVAVTDITPPVGIYARNWGAAQHDVASGVHQPLQLAALVLRPSQRGPARVLLTADLGWWRETSDEWFVRGGLLFAHGLSPDSVVMALSHTHAGPTISRAAAANRPGGDRVPAYIERLRDLAISTVRTAMAAAKPCTITWGSGACDLACNRDLPDPAANRMVCGFHPGVAADNTLLVGRITGSNGTTMATLVNYACHPTTLAAENQLISPDFVGAMRHLVERHTGGAPCLFLQGASGELAPRRQYCSEPAVAESGGRQLGFAVLSALEGMLPARTGLEFDRVQESGAPLALWRETPTQPSSTLVCRKVMVRLALNASSDPPEPTDDDPSAVAAARERRERRALVRQSVGDGDAYSCPLWVWRVGDAALVAQPNEAYSALQQSLRRRFPRLAIMVVNVANGHIGYLPPKEAWAGNLYQAWQTPYAPGCLEAVTEAAGDTIEELFPVS
ncbi:MAG: neutral/alkaline non-lysosomal ceramidase N-terminal domain-containing protein [Armatimonadetes bacterium]|nr:neutral/alkaline non-lysosomal ceramidase N-terminal domain-containing protein [Armatimonadota bacterium]MDE2207419.1 neutral/alkaline non-lysosomal ceramidase N-terminal domain-containing protein [Armatimonadota bacterium]